jgi:molybdopterin synthase sulfur carrier subunit
MKSIKVRYFALLREKAQRSEEEFKTQALTYQDLYQELAARHDFSLPVEMIQVAVNDEYVPATTIIQEGAQVVFIPPVAGG